MSDPIATSHEDMVALHARRHPLVQLGNFRSIEKYVLSLLHRQAYFRAARIARGKAVLDLGCNNGYGSRILSVTADMIAGCDVSELAISAARRIMTHKPIDFRIADACILPFADNAFDLVVCFQLIEHVVDTSAVLGEIARVLAPGGAVIFTTPNAHIRLDPGARPGNRFHVTEYAADGLQSFVEEHFPYVRLAGLTGLETIARVERDRVDRKRVARREGRKPERASPDAVESIEAFAATYGVRDLYYSTDELDRALDLAAVCAFDLSTADEIFAGFTENIGKS